MLRSGIAPIDERLGGLVAGRTYVLTGGTGTGKSVACLDFLNAGIESGERTVMLTLDDPGDLLSQAEYLGIELARALDDERLIMLRYQLDFGRRFSRAPTPELAFEELQRLVGDQAIARLVIDPITPFLDASPASGTGISALQRFLETMGATVILTYPGDLAGLHDRRVEPLMQHAGGIFHLATDRDRTGRIEIRKVRFQVPSTAPITYVVEPGAGLVPLAETHKRRLDDLPEETKRKLLILNLSHSLPDQLIGLLREHFDVAIRSGITSAFSQLMQPTVGAVLIDVNRDTVDDAITLVRELRGGGSRAPVILVTSFTLRSTDRARALRAGADEFLAGDLYPDEFLLRVEQIVRRGRSQARALDVDVPVVMQPMHGTSYTALDAKGFRQAVQAHVTGDRVPYFTVATFRPTRGQPHALAELAMKTMRVDGGDLAGVADDCVTVYLHSARRKDVPPFVERLRDEWRRSGMGELDVETATYPGDEEKLRDYVAVERPDAASGSVQKRGSAA